MIDALSSPEPDADLNSVQSQTQQTNHNTKDSSLHGDAVLSSTTMPDGDNSAPTSQTGSGESSPQPGTVIPPTGDSSDTGITGKTKCWVDIQIPKKKNGNAIISLAKNRGRADIENITRYVTELVAEGKIPMSGKKSQFANGTINTKSVSPFTPPFPLPESVMEAVDVSIVDIYRSAQIRVLQFAEKNVQRIMENFAYSDPVHLFKRPEGELELADGYNRLEAAIRLNKTSIQAYIHEGTLFEALVFNYKINDKHGVHLEKNDRMKALSMIKATPEGSKLTGDQLADMLGVTRQTIHAYLAELRSVPPVKKRAQPDKEVSRKKAVASLMRLEVNFGLTVFRDFVDSLDNDKRAELRAILTGEAQ